MSFALRVARPDELPALAAFAEQCQADPQRHCAYISDTAAAIIDDVKEVPDWFASTLVALDDERNVIGWLLAETDPDMSRVWWWGPFVTDTDRADQLLVANALLQRGIQNHPDHDEHEIAVDRESTLFAALADQHSFATQEGSLALRLDDLEIDRDITAAIYDVPSKYVDDAALAALHNSAFPGTHSTAEMLLRDLGPTRGMLVGFHEGRFAGYVAIERQHDGSLYLDYLGVEDSCRRKGVGGDLVAMALDVWGSDRTYAHLTVREGNAGARALYASLGFTEVRVLAPFRKGFSLD